MDRNRVIYIVGGIVAITVIAIGLLFFASKANGTDPIVDGKAVSPDNQVTATAFEQSWGMSGGHYFVTLSKAGESEVVFDFMPPDSGPYNVSWSDANHLVVQYPGATETYTKLNAYQGIAIAYVECPIAKRKIGSKTCVN